MPITLDRSGTTLTVRLEGEIDVRSANELKATLLPLLELETALAIDLKHALTLDVTILQLLLALRRAGERQGVAVTMGDTVPEGLFLATQEAGLGVVVNRS